MRGTEGDRPVEGAALIVLGMAFVAFTDNFVVLVADAMGLWQFQIIRAAAVLPVALAVAWAFGRLGALRGRARRRLAERTAFQVTALVLYFAALPAIGIGAAAAGLFTAPIWTQLLGSLVAGERLGPRRIAAALLGFVGVCLVLGVGRAPLSPMSAVAVAAGLSYAMSVIWTRQHLRGEEAITVAVWTFAGFGLAGVLGLLAAPFIAGLGIEGAEFASEPWRPVGLREAGIAAATGLAGIVATGLLALGYGRGPSSLMGLFDFSFLVWVPLFAWLLWGTRIGAHEALGMGLVIAAGLLAVWSGARRGEPIGPQSPAR